ncbi:PIF1-like helicase domain-containing protein [Hirsutella rhossiliensis]|uniref:ATP-dependent DNA helicase n=1 Tax=Hirsutella rhossiliensis TaxID=111463 RepID=A0A9P8MS18_9HYPO|nr:PIF1-like helicase domain-containing protein [Hirsutella rhossiliensis]KAH0960377.1 PIF1-like helicase domain-containing protein [Hirsutella rhossiliensis]
MVEEMLIARVHVHVKVLQVRGAQYKYRGHVVHFLRNVGRLFEELPVLPEELDIILLRPPNIEGDPRFRQQFARDFRNRLQRIPLDGSIVASIASQVADIPDGEVPQGPVEEVVEEDPSDADASAIPNLQVTDTELNALHAQAHHQMPLPSIRRTPIDEFNRSQPLLSLAFPTLYPDGKADFVEPRLRSITYQDYLAHAMRWHDGRFARHKTWPFVALNTMLRAQVRKRSDYFVKQRDSRRQPLTRADLEEAMAGPDEPEAQALIQSITRQAAVIRGTRPYWYKQRKELEAYAYNLGKPGLFATASAADYHWESLYRHMPRFDEWQAAPEAARMALSRQLLRDNAHIAAYHFYKRYTLFRTIVLKQKFNLTDSWGRYEWGERNDGQINHYNRLLTVAWLANTDVSPCTSLQQVIDYAAKYCSKSEKKIAERDYSKQEVSHLLLGLPLQEGSRTCLGPNVYEKYTQRPEALADLCYVSFLKCWNFRPRDPSKWKQWQPGNVNGRPRVTTVMVMTITVGQKRLDYSPKMINMRLCLWRKNLTTKTGFASPPFYLGTPLPRKILTFLAAAISTSITTGHGIHPMANDVEVLGPHWRNTLNPQQRLVYDTFMGHFQAQNPTQILLHVDGGGGTGKSFLIKSRLRHVKYLVIDEKSMLGIEQLARIDSRLRQAFSQRSLEFFGGMSVLLVGDFFQLPPVRQKPLYSTSTSLSALERRGHVAYRLFDRTIFLTTVQRQAGDDQARFRQALQELREVKLSIPSWNLLSSRVQARLTQSEVDSFKAALRVYSTRARVEAKNQGKGAGRAPSDNAGNLSNKFPIAKGARGTVYDIAWNAGAEPLEDPPAVIMVDFDSYDGPPYLTTNEGRKISPILPVRRDFLVGNETCARTQFPLMVAFAITVHKCQSLTKDQIVTDLATRDFQAGISYVAVSRVTSLQGLLLEAPFDRQSLYNHTPTEGMKMRLADQQRRQGQQLTDAPYTPRYLD